MHEISRLGGPALSIVQANPPYDTLEPFVPIEGRFPASLPLGAILCVQVQDIEHAWSSLETEVPKLRATYPAAPLVLHLAHRAAAGAVDLARRTAALFVRAILVEDEPFAATLRPIMTHPVDLAGDILEWLPRRGVRVPPECVPFIRETVRCAPSSRSLVELLQELGESEHAVRKRLRARGLPAPSHWHALARAVCVALRLQDAPDRPLLDVALDAGYSEHSTLSRQMVRLFGLRPSVIRTLLGWEPLVDRWVAREFAETAPSHPCDRRSPS